MPGFYESSTGLTIYGCNMTDHIQRLIELEADVRYQELASDTEPEFRYISGDIPVLFSAPHGAVHTRMGNIKQEDEYTSGFARLVAELSGAHVLYVRRKSLTDPNWHPLVPYKLALKQIVRDSGICCVLDMHGSSPKRHFGIALGMLRRANSCPRYHDLIVRTLGDMDFTEDNDDRLSRLDIDHTFSGVGKRQQETITRYVWEKLRIPVVQVELNAYLRVAAMRDDSSTERSNFLGKTDYINRAIEAFVRVAEGIAKYCEPL
jgi:hypothetical protein